MALFPALHDLIEITHFLFQLQKASAQVFPNKLNFFVVIVATCIRIRTVVRIFKHLVLKDAVPKVNGALIIFRYFLFLFHFF